MKSFFKFKKLILITLLLSLVTVVARSDEDENEEGEHGRRNIPNTLIMNAKFKAECTSCHMAYLPGLLPGRSWTKLMNGLDKHFGEDASIDEKSKKEILDFLVKNSSDNNVSRRSSKILSTIGKNDAPIRISETEYFIRKHDELSSSVFKRKAIGSKANCIACHQNAEMGNFNEDEVRIPKATDAPKKK
jgi:nitrate/TMAO reductase-like tetraheme cytochrome c subunit